MDINMSSSTYNRIEPLTKENYDTWCIHAQAVLMKSDLWEYANGDAVLDPGADMKVKSDFAEKDIMARSELFLLISPSELKQVRNCKTAKEVWNKLRETFQSHRSARKAVLLKQLSLNKMQDSGEDVRHHLNNFMDAVDNLANMGIHLNSDLLSILMLYSLPSSYEDFRITVESRDQLPSPEDLKIKIIEEIEARKQTTSCDGDEGAFNSRRNKKNLKCNNCGKNSHSTAACSSNESPSHKQHQKPKAKQLGLNACLSLSTNDISEDVEHLDSECTSHMSGQKHKLQEIQTEDGSLSLASNTPKAEVKDALTSKIRISNCNQPTTSSKAQNPENNFSTATISSPELKSEEHVSLNVDDNERNKHTVELDNNKGKEHITEANQLDSTQILSCTNRALQNRSVTESDNKMSSNIAEQPNCTNTNSCINTSGAASTLRLHGRKHRDEKPYFCTICDKKFTEKGSLDIHEWVHAGKKPYSCNVCDKKFINKSALDGHKHLRVHTGEKPYFCNICDKKFTEKGSFDKHVRVHTGEKPFSCNKCNKKFTQKGSLNIHVRAHTGEKPYSCNLCDKKFTQKKSLDIHVRVHKGEKPYSCNMCDKKFTQKGHLDMHVRIHTDGKPYSCNICNQKFTLKGSLDIHIRVHTGEMPYSCNICDKKFTQKGNLNSHVRVHTGKKPYSCNICDKKFSHKGNLNSHVRVHTGAKPYSCNICDKKFTEKGSLDSHALTCM